MTIKRIYRGLNPLLHPEPRRRIHQKAESQSRKLSRARRASLPAIPRIANALAAACSGAVLTLLTAAPFFVIFEIWQLVLSERYLGVKQIARGADPRTLGLHEVTAFFWSTLLIGYWLWMLILLFAPFGRMHGGGLLLVWMLGFSLRRGVRFKWVLVILTFEGAIRIAILTSLCATLWRKFL